MARGAKRNAPSKAATPDPLDAGDQSPGSKTGARSKATVASKSKPATKAKAAARTKPQRATAAAASKSPKQATTSARQAPTSSANSARTAVKVGRKSAPASAQAKRAKSASTTEANAAAAELAEKDAIIADLQREIEAARSRIVELERRHDAVVNRIDWILDTLRSATEPVAKRKPRLTRKAR